MLSEGLTLRVFYPVPAEKALIFTIEAERREVALR